MRGKEYMAPCTGLQRMPSTMLRTCSVSLAFSAKTLKVAVRSYMWQEKRGKLFNFYICLATIVATKTARISESRISFTACKYFIFVQLS